MNHAEEQSARSQADLVAGLAHARDLIRTAQLEAAEAAATRLLSDFPDDRRPAMLLGSILFRRGKIDEALDLAQESLRQFPDVIEFHRIVARALLEAERLAEVVAETDASADALKMDADLCVYRCRALFGLRRYTQAEALAAEAMQRHPGDTRFALMGGRTLFQMGRYGQAHDLALDAIKATPDDHRIALLLCRSLYALGRYAEASEVAARALAERPNDHKFGLIRCRALLRIGQTDQAKAEADALLQQRPNNPDIIEVARQASGKLDPAEARPIDSEVAGRAEASDAGEAEAEAPGDPEAAASDASKDLQSAEATPQPRQNEAPGSREAAKALTARLEQVRALIKAGQLEEAEAAAFALFEALPSDQRVSLLLCDILLRRDKTDEALKVVEDGIKAFPQTLAYRHLEARALLKKEALAQLEKRAGASLDAFPLDPELTIFRCRALFGLGRFEEVEIQAAQGAKAHETDKRFDLFRCRALHELGRHESVVEVGRAALAKHPDADDIALWICRSLAALGEAQEVVKIAEECLSRDPDSRAFAHLLCDALLRCGAFRRADQVTSNFLAKHPDDPTFLRMRGIALLELGRAEEVRDLLGPVVSKMSAGATPLLRIYINALERIGDWSGIAKTVEPHMKVNEEIDVTILFKLCMAYDWLDRTADQRRVFDKIKLQSEKSLPSDFETAVVDAQKYANGAIPNWQMPAAFLDFLWSLADQDRLDRRAWTEAVLWGRGAQQLLLWTNAAVSSCRPAIACMVAEPDFSQLKAAMEGGQSVLLTAAHLGPFTALIPALAGAEIPTCVVSGIQIPGESSYGGVYTLSFNQPVVRALKQLRGAVRAGHAILAPGDADRGLDLGDQGYCVRVFGREIEVPSLTPRIVFQNKLSSFWCQPHFGPDKIEIDVKPLPRPEDGENRDNFTARWLQAYLDCYVGFLYGDPRNLSIMGGPIRKAFVDLPPIDPTGKTLPVTVDLPKRKDLGN